MSELGRARAVLFDVGGPLDTELKFEQLIDRDICAALRAAGVEVSAGQYAAANRAAVAAFAPNAYQAIIWRLTRGDRERAIAVYAAVAAGAEQRQRERGGIEARSGIAGLLGWLRGRGLLLGLAANQPATALDQLDAAGLGGYFDYSGLSSTHGLRKPDPRLFLHACDALALPPAACIMVGDRTDNDIAPARMLGMRTVLLRCGRHRRQQPRSWEETADAETATVAGLRAAVETLLSP
jgi:putative hydrolase of the HAD superfamily